MKKVTMIFLLLCNTVWYAQAQVKIGDNPGTLSQGSILELESTSKALTLPRMTTVQMQAIPSPLNGMIVFNIDSNCIYLYRSNNVWASINMDGPSKPWPYHSNDSTVGNRGNKEGIISLTGSGLLATGDYSHAEGTNSIASGAYSWAVGNSDTAASVASVAIGSQNKSIGTHGFALGLKNIAGYQASFAFGQENKDTGWASLALGLRNNIFSPVSYSNALGFQNEIRSGSSNIAMGENNIMKAGRANMSMGYLNTIETANFASLFGTNNTITAGNSHFAGGENNIIKSGNANSVFGRSNTADGNYLGAMGKDNIVFYQSAIALGQSNVDSGWASIAGGINNNIRSGVQYSSAFGKDNKLVAGSSNITIGEANILQSGSASVLLGYGNNSQNNFNILGGNLNTSKTGNANSLFGQNNVADGSYLGAIGKDNSLFSQLNVAFGQGNKDSGFASIAGGMNNIINQAVQYSSSFGNGNQLIAGLSHTAMGENNIIVSGRGNSIFGQNNSADGSFLGAIGKDNSTFYLSAVALGQGNKDSGYASLAAGLNNIINSEAQYSSTLGNANQINDGTSHTALGETNIIKAGRANTTIGYANTIESGNFANAFGTANDILAGNSSITVGENNTIKSGNANSLFGQNNFGEGSYLGAIGKDNIVYYQSAIALGQGNKDSGWASIAGGLNNTIKANVQYTSLFGTANQAQGGTSHAIMGEANIIKAGRANTIMGYSNTLESGNFSSAFGTANSILAGNSHFAGGENNMIKSGNSNSLFGRSNIADGSYLGAIGKDNIVYYQSAVALGQANKDSGWASVTGGLGNIIVNNIQYSASFGTNNLSTRNPLLLPSISGSSTFSAGINNINSGYGSIVLGGSNKSSNQFSLSANYNNLANSYGMSAFGHYSDTIPAFQGESHDPGEMLFSIGNGTNDANRRNSLTIMRSGFTTINTTEDNGPHVPRAELDVKGTGAIIVPVGTTAQRPETPVTGMIRFCTDCPGGPVLQGYDGTNWVNL